MCSFFFSYFAHFKGLWWIISGEACIADSDFCPTLCDNNLLNEINMFPSTVYSYATRIFKQHKNCYSAQNKSPSAMLMNKNKHYGLHRNH